MRTKSSFEPLGLVTLGVSAKAELRAAYGGTFLAFSSAAFLALRQPSYAELRSHTFRHHLRRFLSRSRSQSYSSMVARMSSPL